jgi:8-oxo-dGTP pyrophosphatase MutT (NUDIX family)
MDWSELERRIVAGLARPLPGPAAQARLAPRPRRSEPSGSPPREFRRGAGLLLLYPGEDGAARLLLTRRREDLPLHGGQVALPGGAVEPEESPVVAALREAREEVGVAGERVHVRGQLSPLAIPVSRFVLHPVLGTSQPRPDLRPNRAEVARILEVRLDELRDPRRLRVEGRRRDGLARIVPYFAVEGERVWGATAMVLAELLALLGD